MSIDPTMRGLSLEQAPPLSIPMSFFLTAPLGIAAAGVLIALQPITFATRWAPSAAAAAHLGTLGCLAMAMLGALYQMLPVVAGAPVPGIRLAHAVHSLIVVGIASLVTGFLRSSPVAFELAIGCLGAGFGMFVVPAVIAAMRARVKLDTLPGMRIAMVSLIVVLMLGIDLALGRAGLHFALNQPQRLLVHVGLGFVCWVGGLIVPISWQVVPMFYMTEPYPSWARIPSLGAIAASALLSCTLYLVGVNPIWVGCALAPGAVVVWAIHPAITLFRLVRRRRRRVGESVRFWIVAMCVSPLVLVSAITALVRDDPRWSVLVAWLALVGWSSMIVHGMLTRIVPFLIWFHRYSRHVGKPGVMTMRQILPDERARFGLVLHVASLVVGIGAISLRSEALVTLAGACLIATGITLFVTLVRALRAPPFVDISAHAPPEDLPSQI